MITDRPASFCRCQAILPIVVVLPVPFTPTVSSTDGWCETSIRSSPTLRDLGQQLAQAALEVLPAGERALQRLVLEALDHLRGRAGADVGVDQDLLEPFPGLVVERAAERRAQLAAERLARLREVLAQAAEEAALLLLGLGLRRERARRRSR